MVLVQTNLDLHDFPLSPSQQSEKQLWAGKAELYLIPVVLSTSASDDTCCHHLGCPMASPSSHPRFQLGKSKYDLNTYTGRVRHFFNLIDPRTLLVSDAELQESKALLDNYRRGILTPVVTDEQLWKAQKIVQSIVHPDTGEKIPMPFRMSGYVPFGTFHERDSSIDIAI